MYRTVVTFVCLLSNNWYVFLDLKLQKNTVFLIAEGCKLAVLVEISKEFFFFRTFLKKFLFSKFSMCFMLPMYPKSPKWPKLSQNWKKVYNFSKFQKFSKYPKFPVAHKFSISKCFNNFLIFEWFYELKLSKFWTFSKISKKSILSI